VQGQPHASHSNSQQLITRTRPTGPEPAPALLAPGPAQRHPRWVWVSAFTRRRGRQASLQGGHLHPGSRWPASACSCSLIPL